MSAKEMFEKLGYERQEIKEAYYKSIYYKKRTKRIVFRYDKVVIPYEDYDGLEDGTLLNLQELQAINKQVEELGWNE